MFVPRTSKFRLAMARATMIASLAAAVASASVSGAENYSIQCWALQERFVKVVPASVMSRITTLGAI
jgi:hypothetical protein